MGLPNSIDPTTPLGSSARSLGDDQIRALKQFIVDVFGLPASPNTISNAVFSIDQDGDITALRLEGQVVKATYINATDLSNALHYLSLKGTRPGVRFIGSETSGLDYQVTEDGGAIFVDKNTGTEASPTWARVAVLDSTGNIGFYSGKTYKGVFDHDNTADRTYTLPDAATTVVGTDATQTLTNKTINSATLGTPNVSDYILLASANNGTPVAHALYRESRVVAMAVFNLSSGTPVLDGFAKFNVSGNPADDGQGLFTLTWARAFAYASYPVIGLAGGDGGASVGLNETHMHRTTAASFKVFDVNGNAVDREYISVSVLGGHQ